MTDNAADEPVTDEDDLCWSCELHPVDGASDICEDCAWDIHSQLDGAE